MNRSAGVLLPVFSLPSRYGIGCFSRSAYRFADWLKGAGQSCWQILPLGPTGYGDSPYQSFSAFAGNPYFISLEALADEGLLTREECDRADFGRREDRVDYEKLFRARPPLLRLAHSRFSAQDPEYREFVEENRWWLSDYALFMALKGRFGGAPWSMWPEELRLRREGALGRSRRELADELAFQQYLQFLFFRQWSALKAYANRLGIQIIGDIPIYAAMDSADVWAHPELFRLDSQGRPTAAAGVPPDGFAPEGQLWGNPLYRWERHSQTGYSWWISRLRRCFQLYDVTRIDHFRGFDEYYAIPWGQPASAGHWERGPGAGLFRRAEEELGRHPVIAEDLGYVTDSVRRLVRECGFPGMKVLEFAFDARDTGSARDYLPHNYPEHCLACTGTHDNETLAGWFDSITPAERQAVRDYLCDWHTPKEELRWPLIALLLRSQAAVCVIPMQDYLGLDNRSRMNRPSTLGENWRWRLREGDLTPQLQETLRTLALRYGRAGGT